MSRRNLLTAAESSRTRYSEPPRRSARHHSTQSTTTDTSGADDQPYISTRRIAQGRASTARPPSIAPKAVSKRAAHGHRKSASFSKTIYMPFEVDVTTAWDQQIRVPGSKRRSLGLMEEDSVSERSHRTANTERTERTPRSERSEKDGADWTPRPKHRGSSSRPTSEIFTPRANTAKRRKLHVRPSLGTANALGAMTLDRRAEMVADIAGDCLIKLLSIRSPEDEAEAHKTWSSLQVLRQTYLFSPAAPPFMQLREFINGLHPNKTYNSITLAQALQLSNLCSVVWAIRYPDDSSSLSQALAVDSEIGLLRNGAAQGPNLADDMVQQVAQRNALLLMAWRKFWFIAVPKELRASDSAMRMWLDFATLLSRTWQCPTVTPTAAAHPSLPELPEGIRVELFSNEAIFRYGQWESSDHLELSEDGENALDDAHLDADRRLVTQRWRELVKRRVKTLEEKRPEVLARQFDWSKFSSELCAFVRIEVVEADLLIPSGGSNADAPPVIRRAGSDHSVKRRLSSNASAEASYRQQLQERTADDDEEEDLETAESALEESEPADRTHRAPRSKSSARPSASGLENADIVEFDFLTDIIGEMEMERHASSKPATLSPRRKSRALSASRRASSGRRSGADGYAAGLDGAGDGYMADFELFGSVARELEAEQTRDRDQAIKKSKSSSPFKAAYQGEQESDAASQRPAAEGDDGDWDIRDLLPATQDMRPRSAQPPANPKQKFNFAARQLDAERVEWDSQTPVRGAAKVRVGTDSRGGEYPDPEHDSTPRPRNAAPQPIPRLSLTRPSQPAVPTLASRLLPQTPSRAPRDVTEEWVPTPGVFDGQTDEEEEEEVAEEIEVVHVLDEEDESQAESEALPAGRVDAGRVDAVRVPAGHVDAPGRGLSVITSGNAQRAGENEYVDDEEDLLPNPALLRGHHSAAQLQSRQPSLVDILDSQDSVAAQEEDDDGVMHVEQSARPTSQSAFLSSRPRRSAHEGFAAIDEAEDEEDRQLLRQRPVSPEVDTDAEIDDLDIKPFQDPDLLIAPGRLAPSPIPSSGPSSRAVTPAAVPTPTPVQTPCRAHARASAVATAAEIEPDDLDLYLYDEDGEDLRPDPTYTIPPGHKAQRSFIHGQVGAQLSSYSRISGRRKWTRSEELLLYRTVQKVSMTELYPLRVVWYLHGEFGTLSQRLAEFNPQHMRDKMRVIIDRRRNNGNPIVGRARYWLPLDYSDRKEFDAEVEEIRAEERKARMGVHARTVAADARERKAAQEAKQRKEEKENREKEKAKAKSKAKTKAKTKSKKTQGKRKRKAKETDTEEEDELESEQEDELESEEEDELEPGEDDHGNGKQPDANGDEVGSEDDDLNAVSTPPPAPAADKRGPGRPPKNPTWAVTSPKTPAKGKSQATSPATGARQRESGSEAPPAKADNAAQARSERLKVKQLNARAKAKKAATVEQEEGNQTKAARSAKQRAAAGNGDSEPSGSDAEVAQQQAHEAASEAEADETADVVPASQTEAEVTTDGSGPGASAPNGSTKHKEHRKSRRTPSAAPSGEEEEAPRKTRATRSRGPMVVLAASSRASSSGGGTSRQSVPSRATRATRSASARQRSTSASVPAGPAAPTGLPPPKARPVQKMRMTRRTQQESVDEDDEDSADGQHGAADDGSDSGDGDGDGDANDDSLVDGQLAPISEENTQEAVPADERSDEEAGPGGAEDDDDRDDDQVGGEQEVGQTLREATIVKAAMSRQKIHEMVISGQIPAQKGDGSYR